jgi:hypothetical protein
MIFGNLRHHYGRSLPTYESWLMDVEGIDNVERNGWSNGLDNGRSEKIVTVIY